ncbi:MAG: CoA pyrophosphatase [Desulfuromonadales bacterium]|nr:CoA pyrophosphatase [Desulfuromonadales bacterium]
MSAPDLPQIADRLARHQPVELPVDRRHAAVAMLLHQTIKSTDVLFIRRARHDGDPWSGDIGFPGGRLEPGEAHPRQAAERETGEELGLDLGQADCLGRIDDLYGATLPILVSCLVYSLPARLPLRPNHEVDSAFWFPLANLLDRQRHFQARLHYRGRTIVHPAVDLIGRDQALLWGITYRLTRNFFALFDIPFGTEPVLVDARS